MRSLFRGKLGGGLAFVIIAGLVLGGLGWATAAALRLEREQFEARAEKELTQKLHLALWRLDSRLSPVLALEDSRPYNHYSAVYAPAVSLRSDGQAWAHGAVLQPSPLLHAELPEWMPLHFQVVVGPGDGNSGWESPQVLFGQLRRRLLNPQARVPLTNVTDERCRLLEELEKAVPPATLLAAVKERGASPTLRDTTLIPLVNPWGGNPDNDLSPRPQAAPNPPYQAAGRGRLEIHNRLEQLKEVQQEVNAPSLKVDRDVARTNLWRNGAGWFSGNSQQETSSELVDVRMSSLMPLWLNSDAVAPRLLLVRLVKIEDREVCQGIVLDWPRLHALLLHQVKDIFPEADLQPVLPGTNADPELTMGTLPVQLLPGRPAEPPTPPGWTPLRVGLTVAWAASLLALLAVALGGWSLIDLSERRIRFVSAVTHELRTPLTTLRLYLDMLTGGLVREEAQKEEYLHTLNAEADRLNRLVSNVLDFARLERQRPRLQKTTVTLGALLEGLRATWQGRCHDAGKELIVECTAPAETLLATDVDVAQQVLGNLLDNACKYSKGAPDRRIWVRAVAEHGRLTIDVEDRGPGVAAGERRSIFRPFRRGKGADTVGGVGLGLALAERWANLLGGRLTLRCGEGCGACFRLELPLG